MQIAISVAVLSLLSGGCRTAHQAETLPTTLEVAPRHDASHSQADSVPDTAAVRQVQFEQPEPIPSPEEVVIAERQMLTLSDLQSIAFANNPTLAAAAARIEAASGRQFQAGRYPNPVVGYQAIEMGLRDTAGQQGGFVSQRFITGGKLELDQMIAGQEMAEAEFQLLAQEQRVLSDVRLRYYDALVAQRRVELTQELARIGDELVAATKKLLAARLATENDLLQSEIKADESHILLDNARNHHAEAWRRLTTVLGTPAMRIAPLAGDLNSDLPTFDWDQSYAMAVSANPELSAACARVERARIALLRAQKEPIPNIDLFVAVRHHNVTQDDVVNVQAGIPLPLFDKNRGNIHAAQAEWARASRDLERLELALQDRLAVTFRQYENARQQVDRYSQRIVPKAKQSLELVTLGYEKGEVEYLTTLTAQQTYYQANLAYLDALKELWTATSILDGQLLAGSLENRP